VSLLDTRDKERYHWSSLGAGKASNKGATVSDESMKVELERLKEENERLKARQSRAVSLKVSEKGGLSVYGLGRFPVTLYKEQWTKLLDIADDIRAFLKENDSRLKSKE
jgi:hypothetical protein